MFYFDIIYLLAIFHILYKLISLSILIIRKQIKQSQFYLLMKVIGITIVSIIRISCMIISLCNQNRIVDKQSLNKYLFYYLPFDILNISIYAIVCSWMKSYTALKIGL